MKNVPLGDLPGVGWKLSKKLSEKGFRVCSELWTAPRPLLVEWFGPSIGTQLHGWCRGEDSRQLIPFAERKSIGNSPFCCFLTTPGAEVNWGLRFTTTGEVERFLTQLSHEVHERMERAEVAGKTLTLKVKKRKANVPYATVKFLGHGDCDNVSKSVLPWCHAISPSGLDLSPPNLLSWTLPCWR
jgi:DNA repair protein REV1